MTGEPTEPTDPTDRQAGLPAGVLPVAMVVNGEPVTLVVPPEETLLDSLRERLRLTGARYSCGIGVCGTCAVLLDGRPVSSCLLLTVMLGGREVTTAEGLGAYGEAPSEMQQSFAEAGAFQCSFCIPAMALTAHGVLTGDPGASVEDVLEGIAGNLCRCGSYPQIRQAVEAVVRRRAARATEEEDAGD